MKKLDFQIDTTYGEFSYRVASLIINILDGIYTDQDEKETLHWLPIDESENINIVHIISKE